MLESTARALVADPRTPPEMLAQIAEQFPSTWPQIERHPNIYPELVEWIEECRALTQVPPPVPDVEAASTPKNRVSTARITAIVATVAFFVLVAGAAVWLQSNRPKTGAEVVEAFFVALAEGDAETARSFVALQEGVDYRFLTDDVLAKSNQLGTISDINVTPVGDSHYVFLAQYTIAGRAMQDKLSLSDGKIQEDYLAVAHFTDFDSVGPTVNGLPASGADELLFPGAYSFGSTNPNYEFVNDNGITRVALGEEIGGVPVLTLQLSSAGESQFRSDTISSLTACLNDPSAKTVCGLSVTEYDLSDMGHDGVVPVSGTFTWELEQSPSDLVNDAKISWFLYGEVVTKFMLSMPETRWDATFSDTTGDRWTMSGTWNASTTIDFTDPDPVVTWEGLFG